QRHKTAAYQPPTPRGLETFLDHFFEAHSPSKPEQPEPTSLSDSSSMRLRTQKPDRDIGAMLQMPTPTKTTQMETSHTEGAPTL
ncbi:Hypothetical predicted protein, partial [Pelobates cultripes]